MTEKERGGDEPRGYTDLLGFRDKASVGKIMKLGVRVSFLT
jgi:hypothetical protein